MAAIQRSQFRFAQPLNEAQHRRVYETDIGLGMAATKLPNSGIVFGTSLRNRKRAPSNVIQQGYKDAGVKPLVDPVVDLNEHRSRNQEGLAGRLDQRFTVLMVTVVGIQRCEQWTRVDYERHSLGTGRSFPARSEVYE